MSATLRLAWQRRRLVHRYRADAREMKGHAWVTQRRREIAALPVVVWKGQRLRTIRCTGDFGKGPHDMNVPEAILWHLLHFSRFRCAYHQ